MKLLDDMTAMIVGDCRQFGVPEYKIEAYLKTRLCQNPDKNVEHMLFAYNLNGNDGYSVTYWERGRCNFGFGAKDPLDFRFLFQLNIVNTFSSYSTDAKTKQRAQHFMADMKPVFGDTAEYQKALACFVRTWSDFDMG